MKPKINQAIVKAELDRLKRQHSYLAARTVLAEASKSNSPLHNSAGFQWDRDKAAEAHWLSHAQHLIKSYLVTTKINNITFTYPKFVVDPASPARQPRYVEVSDLTGADSERAFLEAGFQRVMGQVGALKHYAYALHVMSDFNELLSALRKFSTTLKSKQQAVKKVRGVRAHQRAGAIAA